VDEEEGEEEEEERQKEEEEEEEEAVHHIPASSAVNTRFETVDLHRPTLPSPPWKPPTAPRASPSISST